MDDGGSDPLTIFLGAMILLALIVAVVRWMLERGRRRVILGRTARKPTAPRSIMHYANTIAPHRRRR